MMAIGPWRPRASLPRALGSQEAAYFAALEGVSHWGVRVWPAGALLWGRPGRHEPAVVRPAGCARCQRGWHGFELVPPPTEDLTMLRAHPWQWVSFTSPVEAFEIEDPANSRVSFNPDASLAIAAGCNDVVGFYQGECGDTLTISIEPVTLDECGPSSRSAQFVKLAGQRRGTTSSRATTCILTSWQTAAR